MSDGWQHIEINDHGTVVILRPISDAARDGLEEHVGEAEPGGVYTCEPRMAQDILQAAARDLLSWDGGTAAPRDGGQDIGCRNRIRRAEGGRPARRPRPSRM